MPFSALQVRAKASSDCLLASAPASLQPLHLLGHRITCLSSQSHCEQLLRLGQICTPSMKHGIGINKWRMSSQNGKIINASIERVRMLPAPYKIIKALLFRIISRNNVENSCMKTMSVPKLCCSGGCYKRWSIGGWLLKRPIEKQVQNLTPPPQVVSLVIYTQASSVGVTLATCLSYWVLLSVFPLETP